jgi:hypothetical protein
VCLGRVEIQSRPLNFCWSDIYRRDCTFCLISHIYLPVYPHVAAIFRLHKAYSFTNNQSNLMEQDISLPQVSGPASRICPKPNEHSQRYSTSSCEIQFETHPLGGLTSCIFSSWFTSKVFSGFLVCLMRSTHFSHFVRLNLLIVSSVNNTKLLCPSSTPPPSKSPASFCLSVPNIFRTSSSKLRSLLYTLYVVNQILHP